MRSANDSTAVAVDAAVRASADGDVLDPERRALLERRRARRGPPPRLAVALEFARAVLGLFLAPLHLLVHVFRARERRAEVTALLGVADAHATPLPDVIAPLAGDDEPLHVFVSCAEISGEIHARRLVERVRENFADAPIRSPRFSGLGGTRTRELGVEIVGDPVSRSAMGFGVVLAIGFYLRLLVNAARHLRATRPDVAVFVDSPALHVPLGRLARAYGVPVVHFVTPQYWGWAPWRAGGYRSAVDLALSILPFESTWFERRGIHCAHVGHPLLDRLARVPARARPVEVGPVALLAGSRASVIERNLPWMLTTLAQAPEDSPLATARFCVALGREDLAERVRALVAASALAARVDVAVGDLHDVLPKCRAALTVSGTVVLDVAHHLVPMVVIYRLGHAWEAALLGRLLTVPWFASVNLLAGRQIVPEFGFAGDGPRDQVRAALDELVRPGPRREACVRELADAVRAAGDERAVERAAGWTLVVGAASRSNRAESLNAARRPG